MPTVNDFCRMGTEIEQALNLREAPIALKILYKNDEVSDIFIRPRRDMKKNLAFCQALTIVRHNRKSIAMLKEDNWCIWPLISFNNTPLDENDHELLGDKHFMKDPEASKAYFKDEYPRLNTQKEVIGYTLSPLSDCSFEPDIVMIYCYPGQLRNLLMASKYETGKTAQASLDTCASCVHAAIPVLNGDMPYNVSIPDPGDYERGLCDENYMIFTMRGDRVEEVVSGIKALSKFGFGYRNLTMDMNFNYPRPEFYIRMFEKWGLEKGEPWGPRF
ncbi:MAG: DUF169 domain-containing protein [Clostridiales bacterium]|nr:DUF169 domain-containing protein [Clostridiales bacterium]